MGECYAMELLSYAEDLLGSELLWNCFDVLGTAQQRISLAFSHGLDLNSAECRGSARKRNGYAWRGMLGSGFDLHCNHSDGIDRQREAKHWNGFEMQADAKE